MTPEETHERTEENFDSSERPEEISSSSESPDERFNDMPEGNHRALRVRRNACKKIKQQAEKMVARLFI